jgi:hypothetical protein
MADIRGSGEVSGVRSVVVEGSLDLLVPRDRWTRLVEAATLRARREPRPSEAADGGAVRLNGVDACIREVVPVGVSHREAGACPPFGRASLGAARAVSRGP